MKPLVDCYLYAFLDSAYLGENSPEFVAEQLCKGGADLIQLRAKNWSVAQIQATAERILPITNEAGVGLIINDFFRIAESVGAFACHLGQEDFFDAGFSTRSQLNFSSKKKPLLGLSSHGPNQAERAVSAGADYVAVGPVFATPTKPQVRPVTCDYVRWASQHLTLPWFAIGGITLSNLNQVLEAGATRVCIVSAILNSPNIAAACHEFKVRLRSTPD